MNNLNNQKDCCKKKNTEIKKNGFLSGLLYGVLPHTFCILFIIFTILGATVATAILKPLMLNPYFFYILIGLSFFFATISAAIYLKRGNSLSPSGARKNWKYLSVLYGTTIIVNVVLFMVIFPLMANFKSDVAVADSTTSQTKENSRQEIITLEVEIPCSGHASLVTDELHKIEGVKEVKFSMPNSFDISYDPNKTSKEKIMSLEIFNTYKAKIIE